MSPHGIARPSNQSSQNSRSKCRLAGPVTPPNFIALRQEVCAVEIFFSHKVDQVYQNRLRPAAHRCPSLCQISSRSAKRCTRKVLQIFILFSILLRHGDQWAKVHQSSRIENLNNTLNATNVQYCYLLQRLCMCVT